MSTAGVLYSQLTGFLSGRQVVLLAVLRHESSGRELCVATTHLKARAGALMSTLRNEQGRDLLRLVATLADGRPVLLAGDFNAEPTEPVYRTLLQNPGLRLASAYSKASHQVSYRRTWVAVTLHGHRVDINFTYMDVTCTA